MNVCSFNPRDTNLQFAVGIDIGKGYPNMGRRSLREGDCKERSIDGEACEESAPRFISRLSRQLGTWRELAGIYHRRRVLVAHLGLEVELTLSISIGVIAAEEVYYLESAEKLRGK